MKKIQVIFITLTIVIGGSYTLYRWNIQKMINKTDIDIMTFINCTDDVSGNKIQVNWKHVAAIIGVIEHNDFEKIDELDVIGIAQMFIDDSNELNSLDTVLNELGFSKREKERAYKYIEDLRYYSITPNRTFINTKYTKFIERIKDGAIENYRRYKVLPSITIAQAILESNWGKSALSSKFNNLFGIKADSRWKGESIILQTTEFNGMSMDDKFRVYEDQNQSVYDHGEFLFKNKRYKEHGVFECNTYKYQVKALQDAGYSTLTNEKGEKLYAKKLMELIQQYNLQIIDSEVNNKKYNNN